MIPSSTQKPSIINAACMDSGLFDIIFSPIKISKNEIKAAAIKLINAYLFLLSILFSKFSEYRSVFIIP